MNQLKAKLFTEVEMPHEHRFYVYLPTDAEHSDHIKGSVSISVHSILLLRMFALFFIILIIQINFHQVSSMGP